MRIVAIVEGHGELEAVPILVRRIAQEQEPAAVVDVPRPIRTKRQRFLKDDELERTVELAARQCGPNDGILILMDADDDCPVELAGQIMRRAQAKRADRRIQVVVAKREYEAWFLATAESVAGRRGIAPTATAPPDPEAIADAKAWLSARMPANQSYRETLDQPALSAVFDLAAARTRSPSFDKLYRDIASLVSQPNTP